MDPPTEVVPSSTTQDAEKESELEYKLRSQVEFYFSNSNLPRDKFLRAECEKDPEGFVPIATIATFKRMMDLTKDISLVVKAIRASEELVVSEEGDRVRRRDPLPENDDTVPRSIYAKGFPKSEPTIDEITKFFSEFGVVKSVRIRRFPKTREFKRSVFLEFESQETAAKVIDMILTFPGGDKLKMEMKSTYLEKKKKEYEEMIAKRSNNANNNNKSNEKQPVNSIVPTKQERTYTPGLILKLSGLSGDTLEFKRLKEICRQSTGRDGGVGYVEIVEGTNVAKVRFTDLEAAVASNKFFNDDEHKEARIQLVGEGVSATGLEGDEEKEFWDGLWQAQDNRGGDGGGRGGRGGGGRGGRGGGRGGRGQKRDRDRDGAGDRRSSRQRT